MQECCDSHCRHVALVCWHLVVIRSLLCSRCKWDLQRSVSGQHLVVLVFFDSSKYVGAGALGIDSTLNAIKPKGMTREERKLLQIMNLIEKAEKKGSPKKEGRDGKEGKELPTTPSSKPRTPKKSKSEKKAKSEKKPRSLKRARSPSSLPPAKKRKTAGM